ncbi:hypothetical protein ACFVU4_35400, partial [Streptomyces sp. NPDC058107]
GKVIDPMTYIAKGAGAGLSKIGDITKGLKGIANIEIPKLPDDAIVLPEGALKLPDGAVHLPEGAAIPDGAVKLPDGNFKLPDDVPVLPEGATKLPTDPGAPAQYFDHDGNLLNEKGDVIQKAEDARPERSPDIHSGTGADTPHTGSPDREPALVGAGAHTADATAHVGANAGDHVIRIGDSLGNDLGDIGRTGDNLPSGNIGNHLPGGGVGDHMPTGHAGDNFPGSHAGDNMPSNNLDNAAPGSHVGDHVPGPRTETPGVGGPEGPARASNDTIGDASRSGEDLPGEHADHRDGPGHDEGPGRADDSSDSNPAEDQPDREDAGGKPDDDNPYVGNEPDYSRPALLPADGPLTLREVRNTHHVRTRWERGEEFHRQMWGGGPERHYPVPTSTDPRYPVTATGGRKVDVPVDLPGGRTAAVEVKTYGPYRTITLRDGTHQTIRNEVPLSKHIKEQIHKDVALRRMDPGYDPRWSFTHAGPSDELRAYLKKAKIIFLEYGPTPKKDRWDLPKKA